VFVLLATDRVPADKSSHQSRSVWSIRPRFRVVLAGKTRHGKR